MSKPDRLEWLSLRIALGVVALIVAAVVVGWKAYDFVHPRPTRLELTLRRLVVEKGVVAVAPAGGPLSATASAGSLRATIEGSGVIAARRCASWASGAS